MKLPHGWTIEQVGDLFEVQLGKMLNKEAKAKNPQFPYLGNTNVKWGHFDLSDLKTMYFSERDVGKFSLKKNDIIMCEGGEVGRCAIWKGSSQNIYYQKALHRLRTKGGIIPVFFQNYMENISGTKRLDDYTTRTSIAHLTREKLVSIPVILPPLPEQKKIAQILSTWDDSITANEDLLANSRLRKKALMQQLLTGKKRLPGFVGGWKKIELGDALNYEQPTPFLVKSTDYSNEFPTPVLTAGKTFLLGYTNEESGIYEQGLPVIIFDDFTTACQFVDFPFKAKSSAMKILTPKLGYSIRYIFEALRMIRFPVGGHQRHWISIFSNLVISCPSIEEQKAIASVLTVADEEIEALEQRISNLKLQKKALMQQLLTGKKRVKVDTPERV